MLEDFISLVFPRTCIGCNRGLLAAENFICTPCKIDIPLTFDLANPTNKLLQKFAYEPKIRSATSMMYFIKGGIAQKLLHAVKYNHREDLAIFLGTWLAQFLPSLKVDTIVPVPLHPTKKRIRTFNQSEAIAQGLSGSMGIPCSSTMVSRIINTKTQTKKGKADRWRNVENIYSQCQEDLSGLTLLVVDDVATTGATIGMLCERLVAAGAKELHIVTLARR